DRLPGGEPVREAGPAELAAFGEDRRPAGAVDGFVDTSAAEERTVRGVHHGVHRQSGDVAAVQIDPGVGAHLVVVPPVSSSGRSATAGIGMSWRSTSHMMVATSPTQARLTHQPARMSLGKCTPSYMRDSPILGTYTEEAAITGYRHRVGLARTHAQAAREALAMACPLGKE